MIVTTAVEAKGPKPSGKVKIESTSIAAGVGVSWGDGTLRFKGKQYQFSIEGMTLVDVGISKASAVGDVYDLKDVSQFEGTYVAGEAGFALAGGMRGDVVAQPERGGDAPALGDPKGQVAARSLWSDHYTEAVEATR